MSSAYTEPLFIQGIQKTGTSTLVGILNTHPEIFILYETRMDKAIISKYGNQLLERFPEARRFFRNTLDISQPYIDFAQFLKQSTPTIKYRYFGDKIITFNSKETHHTKSSKTIYTIRDVRTWLCKEQIVQYYRTDLDVISPAIDFLQYVIGAHRYSNCLIVRMEDMIENNEQVLANVSKFLDFDLMPHANQWWQKIGQYEEQDPKNFIQWFKGHQSSKVRPQKVDTAVRILPHPFWDDYLPLFDKYYQTENNKKYTSEEINADLVKANELKKYAPLPLKSCYENISTKRLSLKNTKPAVHIFQKIKRLVKKGIKK